MLCPYCGSTIKDFVTVCRMCGKDIDREEQYRAFISKGDASMEISAAAAVVNYARATEFIGDRAEGYIRLGNAFEKKGDANAAALAYMQALQTDFKNEQAHNLLISFFERQGRLVEIRQWYQKNSGGDNAAIAEKYTGVIDGIIRFKSGHQFVIPAEDRRGMSTEFLASVKQYSSMNMVIAVLAVFGGLLAAAMYFFHVDPVYILMLGAAFFLTGFGILVFIGYSRKKKQKHKTESLEQIMDGFRKKDKPI